MQQHSHNLSNQIVCIKSIDEIINVREDVNFRCDMRDSMRKKFIGFGNDFTLLMYQFYFNTNIKNFRCNDGILHDDDLKVWLAEGELYNNISPVYRKYANKVFDICGLDKDVLLRPNSHTMSTGDELLVISLSEPSSMSMGNNTLDPESLVNEIVGFSVMTIVGEINMTPVKDLLRVL